MKVSFVKAILAVSCAYGLSAYAEEKVTTYAITHETAVKSDPSDPKGTTRSSLEVLSEIKGSDAIITTLTKVVDGKGFTLSGKLPTGEVLKDLQMEVRFSTTDLKPDGRIVNSWCGKADKVEVCWGSVTGFKSIILSVIK